jgi:two-component system, NarL family, response regulator NreC
MVKDMAQYNIILADDHALVRQGLKRIIQEDHELVVVDEADDGLDLLHILEESTPDMVILDLSMPRLRGLEAIKLIKGLYPDVKILILTMHRNKEYFYQAMSNGADGYLLKDDVDLTLLSAINTIRRGETFISPQLFG